MGSASAGKVTRQVCALNRAFLHLLCYQCFELFNSFGVLVGEIIHFTRVVLEVRKLFAVFA